MKSLLRSRTCWRTRQLIQGRAALRWLSRAADDLESTEAEFAICVVKPTDNNAGYGIGWKNIRYGPDVFAVTSVQRSQEENTKYDGVEDDHFKRKATQADSAQDEWGQIPILEVPTLERSKVSQRGSQHDAKLLVGAPVVANFELYGDPYLIGMAAWEALFPAVNALLSRFTGVRLPRIRRESIGSQAMSYNANAKQGYGTVLALHKDADGRISGAEIAFQGNFSQGWDKGIKLREIVKPNVMHDLDLDGKKMSIKLDCDGYVAWAAAERLTAHAGFRNIFLITTLRDLRWELALIWPRPVNVLEDITFVDSKTGEHLGCVGDVEVHIQEDYRDFASAKTGKTIKDIVDGDVEVHIHGKRVHVLDPTNCTSPKVIF